MNVSFLVDVVLTFFQEFWNNSEHVMVNTHRDIAKSYLKGWLIIDVLSIIPFDLFLANSSISSVNSSLRIARTSKIYKIVRLVRLGRLTKAVRTMSSNSMKQKLRIQASVSRLSFFLLGLVLMIHLLSCGWIMLTQIDEARNWMELKV